MDLDAYFDRIGYRGSRAPTLATLHAITAAHVMTIPFENIDVVLNRGVDLEPDALFRKLVTQKRGGYCFEQNGLLLLVLEAMGFSVVPLSGRVRVGRPREYLPARTHVFLRVTIDGTRWLTDVGVGSSSLTSALRFDVDNDPQETPHETRRLVTEGAIRYHQIKYGETWNDVYEFTGEEMPFIDRVVGSWYTSDYPKSHFKDRLTVAKALPDGRRATILNRDFTLRERDGSAEVKTLDSPAALAEVLQSQFGLGPFTEDELRSIKPCGF